MRKHILRISILGLYLIVLSGCGGGGGGGGAPAPPVSPPPPTGQPKGTLKITNPTPKTTYKISDTVVTLAADGTLLLDPGNYQLSALRSGYTLENSTDTLSFDIVVGNTTQRTLQFKRKAPPSPPGWPGTTAAREIAAIK